MPSTLEYAALDSCETPVRFTSCYNLSYVSLPWSRLTKIATSTFYHCRKLSISLDLPNISQIESFAFYGCSNSGFMSVSAAILDTLGEAAFYNCRNLRDINMPNLKTINHDAFYSCFSLMNINAKPKMIGSLAFGSCSNLSTIDLTLAESIGDSAFVGCSKLNNITLTDTLKYVGYDPFARCSLLSSYTYIGDTSNPYRFLNKCNSSLSIYFINKSCQFINGAAFERNSYIQKLVIPGERIINTAFYTKETNFDGVSVDLLNTIYFLSDIKLDSYTIRYHPNLNSVYLLGSINEFPSADIWGMPFGSSASVTIYARASLVDQYAALSLISNYSYMSKYTFVGLSDEEVDTLLQDLELGYDEQ